jgi:hypothetical protein
MAFQKSILFFLLSSVSLVVSSQTADEVINKYISYIGGEKNWKEVKTMTISGVYNYVGVSFPFISYSKRPDLYKYVVTANGKSFTQAYDGKQGWRIDGFKDESDKTMLKDRKATGMANEADVELESPFINYREKGHTIKLEGIDTSVNHGAYKINLTRRNGDLETYFFSTKDFSLLKKKTLSTNDEMDKAPLDVEYSNYKLTGKIKTPHTIAHSTNGQPILKISVERIQLNLPVNDSIFKP